MIICLFPVWLLYLQFLILVRPSLLCIRGSDSWQQVHFSAHWLVNNLPKAQPCFNAFHDTTSISRELVMLSAWQTRNACWLCSRERTHLHWYCCFPLHQKWEDRFSPLKEVSNQSIFCIGMHICIGNDEKKIPFSCLLCLICSNDSTCLTCPQ